MIAGDHPLLLLAVLAVDPHRPGARRHGGGGQQEVDAQPQVLVEVAGPVVPPGELRAGGMEAPVEVGEAEGGQRGEPLPLLRGVEDAAFPGGLVPGVEGAGTEVEVAAHQQVAGTGQLLPQELCQAIEERQLVGEFRVPGAAPVGHVHRDAGERLAAGRGQLGADQPGALPLQPGQAAGHRPQRAGAGAGQNRHPVPTLLPVDHRPVAGLLQLGVGEAVGAQLQFLQQHQVRGPRLQPVAQKPQPRLHAVDVPGGDDHRLPLPRAVIWRRLSAA